MPDPTKFSAGDNVECTLTGKFLTITVDLSKARGPSKSGKTVVVATTKGFSRIPGTDDSIGLNVTRLP